MRDEDAFFAAVDRLYAAALDAPLWPDALGAVARLLGGQGTTLELKNRRTNELLFFDQQGLDPKGVEEYGAHYHSVCGRWREFHTLLAGDVCFDYRLMSEAELCRDEFYEDFLKRFDLRYYVSGLLENDGTRMGLISVQRAPRVGHVADAEIAWMRRLVPHVQRALDLHVKLRRGWRRESGLRATLDQLKLGAVLVDLQATVLYMNDAARVLLGERATLALSPQALGACEPGQEAALWAAIRAALSSGKDKPPSAGSVELGDASQRVSVVVLPLSVQPEFEPFYTDRCEKAPAAIVFLLPRGLSARALALLGDAHGLTFAEQQLAVALVNGQTLVEHAAARGVTVHTVRTHLVNLRAKLGVRTQAELVERLLAAAPAMLR